MKKVKLHGGSNDSFSFPEEMKNYYNLFNFNFFF